jgi:hypothetical protein
MLLKTGMRLRSQVCDAEVIVVRPVELPGDLLCGGRAMVGLDVSVTKEAPASGLASGALLGKRYTLPSMDTLEILVTKAGVGSLSIGDELLEVKAAKPLPSSD